MLTLPVTRTTESPEQTWALAAQLASQIRPGTVIALHGELGAGKTCFVQGLGFAMGVRKPMTSPTFTIANEYETPKGLFVHMDLYRLGSPDELLALGFEQTLRDGAIIAVEWPDRAGDTLPPDTIHVKIELLQQGEARCYSIQQAG